MASGAIAILITSREFPTNQLFNLWGIIYFKVPKSLNEYGKRGHLTPSLVSQLRVTTTPKWLVGVLLLTSRWDSKNYTKRRSSFSPICREIMGADF